MKAWMLLERKNSMQQLSCDNAYPSQDTLVSWVSETLQRLGWTLGQYKRRWQKKNYRNLVYENNLSKRESSMELSKKFYNCLQVPTLLQELQAITRLGLIWGQSNGVGGYTIHFTPPPPKKSRGCELREIVVAWSIPINMGGSGGWYTTVGVWGQTA